MIALEQDLMALLIALSVGSGNLRLPGGIAETTGVSVGGCKSWRICSVSKSPGAFVKSDLCLPIFELFFKFVSSSKLSILS